MKLAFQMTCCFFSLGLMSCISTSNFEERVEQADSFAERGLYREAIEEYKEALKLNASDTRTHAHLGFVFLKAGAYKQAILHLERSLPEFKDSFDVHFAIGEAYRVTEAYSKAIFHYQQALELRRFDLSALRALAWTYLNIHFYSEALRIANQASTFFPKDEDTKVILAKTYIRLKQYSQAETVVRAFSWSKKNRAVSYCLSGDISEGRGRYDEASGFYHKALKDNPLLASALFGLSGVLIKLRDFAQARTYLEKGIRIAPKYKRAYLDLARIYEPIDRKKSVAFYEKFRELAETDPEFIDVLEGVEKKISFLEH